MPEIKFYNRAPVPMEMHKVKIVQKLTLLPAKERLAKMEEAGFNTFLLHNKDIFMDMLTDSGVNAMSDNMQSAMLRADDGTLTPIDNSKLYFVVAGMYMGQMLGSVEETSMGLLTVTPRDEQGNPIATEDLEDLVNYVIKDEDGNPLKEWAAIASYLETMGGEMDARYAEPDGRKVIYASLSPVKLLKNANIFTYAVLILAAVIIATPILIVCAVRRRKKHKKG